MFRYSYKDIQEYIKENDVDLQSAIDFFENKRAEEKRVQEERIEIEHKNKVFCLCCGRELKGITKSKYNYCGWCLKKMAQEAKENYKYEYKEVKYKTLKELAQAMEISLPTLKKYLNGSRKMPYKLYREFFYLNDNKGDYDKIQVKYDFDDLYYIEIECKRLIDTIYKKYWNKEDLVERTGYTMKEVNTWFYKQVKVPSSIKIKRIEDDEDVTKDFFLQ